MQTLIKTFQFSAEERAGCTFSDATKIFIDGKTDTAKLRPDATGAYPTADGIWIASAVTTPRAARQLLKAQSKVRHVRVGDGNTTSDGYRLHDGVNHYWWSGSAWTVVATSSTSWNTEAQLNAGLASFQLGAARAFGVVVKLTTTDSTVTPELFDFKVAYSARVVSFVEDLVMHSLTPDMEAKVRAVASFVYQVKVASNTVDVGTMTDLDDTNFSVTGLDGVFDFNADTNGVNDLLTSYDPTTRRATLSSTMAAGTLLRVEVIYAPKISVANFDPDFIEVAKVPGMFVSFQERESSEAAVDDAVVNKSDGSAIVVPAPYRSNLDVAVTIMTAGGKDLLRLAEELKGYAMNNPVVKSLAIDEGYRFFLRDEFADISSPGQAGVRVATATFSLLNVSVWKRPARNETAMKSVTFGGSLDASSGSGQPPIGDGQ